MAEAFIFVYHACPVKMLGNTLYPLQDLVVLDAKLHARELAKYGDREVRKHLPEQHIAKLECKRSEVLNFAPIHPQLIFQA